MEAMYHGYREAGLDFWHAGGMTVLQSLPVTPILVNAAEIIDGRSLEVDTFGRPLTGWGRVRSAISIIAELHPAGGAIDLGAEAAEEYYGWSQTGAIFKPRFKRVQGIRPKAKSAGVHPNSARAAARGSTLHSDKPGHLPQQLRQMFPNTTFKFRPPGKPGPDVRVSGGQHPSKYKGSSWPTSKMYGDFKPNTPNGLKAFQADQRNKWKVRVHRLPYDPKTGQLL